MILSNISKIRISLICAILFFCSHSNSSDKNLEQAGDYLQIGLPLTALVSSYMSEDKKTPKHLQYKNFIRSFSYGYLATLALKGSVEKRRPNGGNEQSFPSGHTFAAVSGAAFINSRFGYKYGIPAYLLAGLVGYSRIDSNSHFADDVLAGATIAFLFNEYATSPDHDLSFGVSSDSVNVGYRGSLESYGAGKKSKEVVNFSFLLGPTYIQHLNFDNGRGIVVPLSDLPNEENYNYTSVIKFDWLISNYHILNFSLNPYEHFTQGSFDQDISIENNIFPSGDPLKFNWIQYDLDIDYTYKFYSYRLLDFFIGAGLYTTYSRLEVSSTQNLNEYISDRLGLLGNFIGKVKVNFSQSVTSTFQVNWYKDNFAEYFKANLRVDYEINNKWGLVAQLQHYDRELRLSEFSRGGSELAIESDSSFNSINVGVKLSFF